MKLVIFTVLYFVDETSQIGVLSDRRVGNQSDQQCEANGKVSKIVGRTYQGPGLFGVKSFYLHGSISSLPEYKSCRLSRRFVEER